uniref:Adenylate isopentenyltransferase n=1 Tax=Opuntia streptacantha TaxID=393608 RepID=A0A7C9A1C4_OPUST
MRLLLRSIYHCCCAHKSKPLSSPLFKPPTISSYSYFSSSSVLNLAAAASTAPLPKEKLIVVMGPTGSGKSRLSVDLGNRFPAEIINSDKIQVYKGLDITTNKITREERRGVPHHFLGEVDSSVGEYTPAQYRSRAASVISGIISRRRIPMIVGGSNSFIYALLTERFNPESDVFGALDPVSSELRYNCCFLWIDLSIPVLNEYLDKRVDDMLESGMVEELAEFYESGLIDEWEPNSGLRKAIGVPEFERYFREKKEKWEDDRVRGGAYREAVKAIKDNTCQLAKRQIEKIQRLKMGGWGLQRLDASDSFRAVLDGSKSWSDIWERQVLSPSVKIVKRFLEEE